MGYNPPLHIEVKLAVHLFMALLLYHERVTSQSVYSMSKLARELHTYKGLAGDWHHHAHRSINSD